MTNGLDVSHFNGAVDWPRVGQACDFAIIKATQGATGVDPQFTANRAGAVAHVQVVGAYHYATPGDPIVQANHFYATAGKLPILALDLEEQNAPTPSWRSQHCDPQDFATRFLAELARLSGQAPWIYTGPGFIAEYGIDQTAYRLWLAQYGPVAHPAPWAKESIWQYADNGTVPGVPRPCDVNRSDLTVEELGATPTPGGFLMALTDAQQTQLLQTVENLGAWAFKAQAQLDAIKGETDRLIASNTRIEADLKPKP